MDRPRVVLSVGLVALMLLFVATVALLRANRPPEPSKPVTAMESPPQEKAVPRHRSTPPEPARPALRPAPDAEKQGAALHDATLLGLIQSAKVAQQRGDTKTRDAMLAGLKKQPERSKELLKKEIAAAQDRNVAYALQTLMQELQ